MEKKFVISLFVFLILTNVSFAKDSNPCVGKGTALIYLNGMFSTERDAQVALRHLVSTGRTESIFESTRELIGDSAYQQTSSILTQLIEVAAQKGVSDFTEFWAALSGISFVPEWLKKAIEQNLPSLPQLEKDELEMHLEKYSRYFRSGYNIVLVSHSQGNFYANAALRNISKYITYDLQNSIDDLRTQNPYYPLVTDIFKNIQVATPVLATVNNSPWITFDNDRVINGVRKTLGALPGNVNFKGATDDILMHSFLTYMKLPESRKRILEELRKASNASRYPIPKDTHAVTVNHPEEAGSAHMEIIFENSDSKKFGWVDIRKGVISRFFKCIDYIPNEITVRLETFREKDGSFEYTALPSDDLTEKPIRGKGQSLGWGTKRWRLGTVKLVPAQGKDPVQFQANFFSKPEAL